MNDLGRLRGILNPGLIVNWKDEIAVLKEKDKHAKLKEVKIKGLIEGSLVLKMDYADTQKIFKGMDLTRNATI
ncbi:MAG: hypothetical protein JXR73_07295 [Candidatus Omnitrophica bacterium]|nr:hypothetical protein [Candidatus Omnitrophota bacterium]